MINNHKDIDPYQSVDCKQLGFILFQLVWPLISPLQSISNFYKYSFFSQKICALPGLPSLTVYRLSFPEGEFLIKKNFTFWLDIILTLVFCSKKFRIMLTSCPAPDLCPLKVTSAHNARSISSSQTISFRYRFNLKG